MIKINQEKGKDPEWREKVSKAITKIWDKDPEYRKKQEDERKERAKNPNFINKMREIGKKTKKEISDKRQFLNDIKNNMRKKDMLEKYKIGKNSYNKRIQEMFGPNGPKNYTELKDYLQGKDVNDVLKEIEERETEKESEKLDTGEDSEISDPKSQGGNPKEKNQQSDELDKDSLDGTSSLENQDEKIEDTKKNPVGEPDEETKKSSVDEKSSELDEKTPETSGEKATGAGLKSSGHKIGIQYSDMIRDKREFLNDIKGNMSEMDVIKKYDISSSTLNAIIQDMFGLEGPRNQSELHYHLQNEDIDKVLNDIKERKSSDRGFEKNAADEFGFSEDQESDTNNSSKDYEGIDQFKPDKGDDIKGIDENVADTDKDYNRLDINIDDKGRDFDGIDNPQEKGDKDYDEIDEEYPKAGVENGGRP